MPLTRSGLRLAKDNNDVEFVAEYESYAFVDLTKLERRKVSKKAPLIKQEFIAPAENATYNQARIETDVKKSHSAVDVSNSEPTNYEASNDQVFRVDEIVEGDRDNVPMEIDVVDSEAGLSVSTPNNGHYNYDMAFQVTEIIEESSEDDPMSEGEDNEDTPPAIFLQRRGSKDSGFESPPATCDREEPNSDVMDEDDLFLAPKDLKDGQTLASPEVPEEQGQVEQILTPEDQIDNVKTEPADDEEEYLRQLNAVKKLESEVMCRLVENINDHFALLENKKPEQADNTPTPRALPDLEQMESAGEQQIDKKKPGKKAFRRGYTQFPEKLRMLARDINVPSVTFTEEGLGFIFSPDRFEQEWLQVKSKEEKHPINTIKWASFQRNLNNYGFKQFNLKNKKAKDIKQKIFFVPKDVDEHLGTNHKYKIAKFPKSSQHAQKQEPKQEIQSTNSPIPVQVGDSKTDIFYQPPYCPGYSQPTPMPGYMQLQYPYFGNSMHSYPSVSTYQPIHPPYGYSHSPGLYMGQQPMIQASPATSMDGECKTFVENSF
ncbi:Oidioi.mRNA.OKI2018_I69.chr2.g6850.t1.cds [Oikopleura dioica]|uniref:Oidioi.mRNA.OKI2018_I69.chr2.g6850.t1.cds n=1 Tax=Oikopleura dioica TaxID=34765 RepID=A0ABN7TDJ4_OIKDI|nr:Oidioi.mRNA.OKI2018_I69.chr2.g6850.t1.cds [Oikopleura dioica]